MSLCVLKVTACRFECRFGPSDRAGESAPILARCHDFAASRHFGLGFIDAVPPHVESRQPWTRAHLQPYHVPSICVIESIFEESFGASMLTENHAASDARPNA